MGYCFQCGQKTNDDWIKCPYCNFKLDPKVIDNNFDVEVPTKVTKVERIEDKTEILKDILTKNIFQIIKDNPKEKFTWREIEQKLSEDIKTSPIRMILALNKLHALKLVTRHSLKENHQYEYFDPESHDAKIQKELKIENERKEKMKIKLQLEAITQKLESEKVPEIPQPKIDPIEEPKYNNASVEQNNIQLDEIISFREDLTIPKIEEIDTNKISVVKPIERSDNDQVDLFNAISSIFSNNPKKAYTSRAIINELIRENDSKIKKSNIVLILEKLIDYGFIKKEFQDDEWYYFFIQSNPIDEQISAEESHQEQKILEDLHLGLKYEILNILKSNSNKKLEIEKINKFLKENETSKQFSGESYLIKYHLLDMTEIGIINCTQINRELFYYYLRDPINEIEMKMGIQNATRIFKLENTSEFHNMEQENKITHRKHKNL